MIVTNQSRYLLKEGEELSFGSTQFLAEMYLSSMVYKGEATIEGVKYNEIFQKIIQQKNFSQLDLLLIYMKTFQKDVTNKCKKIFFKEIKDIRVNKEVKKQFMIRCNFLGEFALKYLPLNVLFFELYPRIPVKMNIW